MIQKYIFAVLAFAVIHKMYINAYSEKTRTSISLQLDPIAKYCVNKTGVSQKELDYAQKTKNFDSFSACFFFCFFKNVGLIKIVAGSETLDIPATLVFAKKYIPTINIINLFETSAIIISCNSAFQNTPGSDFEPGCPKTRVLTDCLAGSQFLNKLIKNAIKSSKY